MIDKPTKAVKNYYDYGLPFDWASSSEASVATAGEVRSVVAGEVGRRVVAGAVGRTLVDDEPMTDSQ